MSDHDQCVNCGELIGYDNDFVECDDCGNGGCDGCFVDGYCEECSRENEQLKGLALDRNSRIKQEAAGLREEKQILLAALKEVVSDLFYQIEAKHGPKAASEYPSIVQAREAITKAGDRP